MDNISAGIIVLLSIFIHESIDLKGIHDFRYASFQTESFRQLIEGWLNIVGVSYQNVVTS